MNDIPIIRIIRWFLACVIAFIISAFIFGSGIAAAESGSIQIDDLQTKSYTLTQADDLGVNWTRINFDTTDYNSISSFHIKSTSTTFINNFESTYFNVVSCGSGNGYLYYDKNYSTIYFAFSPGFIATCTPVILNYSNMNVINNITHTNTRTTVTPGAGNPVIVGNPSYNVGGDYQATVSTIATDYYDIKYLSGGLFSVNITKNQYISSKYFILGQSSIYSQETEFNKTNITGAIFTYNDGLILNTTLQSGIYFRTTINTTGITSAPSPTDDYDPETGIGIIFDKTSYALGDIANISWIRTKATPTGYIDSIVIIKPDGSEEELISSPPDSGYIKYLMSPSGSWKVEFRRALLGLFPTILKYDTAAVGAEGPSYIYVPAAVGAGKLFNATYKIGFTQTSSPWIKTYIWENEDWQYQNVFTAPGTKGIEYNASILVTKPGKYLIKLCDSLLGCKASTSTEAFFNGSDITINVSSSNITLDKTTYSYGETMTVKSAVDNTNWTTKQIITEYYDYTSKITQTQVYVLEQIQTTPIYISDLTFSGSGISAMRLVGRNDTGNYVLAFANFTLSSTDAEGYGLSYSGNSSCAGNTINIKVIVPTGEKANLSISADDVKYNKDYIINGTKTVPYKLQITGTYYITLRVNGDAKRLIIINTDYCAPAPTATTTPGTGQAQEIANLLTTNAFWAFIITVGLMLWVGYKTKDGFSTGTIGMLSAGIFSYIGWLPFWIFISVLIVAIVLLANMILSKQEPKP